MNCTIIIPAHNEEHRILKTLAHYHVYFSIQDHIKVTLLVVLNGCTDQTLRLVQEAQKEFSSVQMIELAQAGKGLAIKAGFLHTLGQKADIIGFVDADMATRPEVYHQLFSHIQNYDGIIASRYSKEATCIPARPLVKRWGSKLIYEPLIKQLFGMGFRDYQCGAKLFKRKVIEKIAPLLTVKQWAFDIELLYLCKKYNFTVQEVPTVWTDQKGSKLKIFGSGLPMLKALFEIKRVHK